MDAAAARGWLTEHFDVPRETLDRIAHFLAFLAEENRRHNLVAASTLDDAWSRHVVDSAQLLLHGPDAGTWLDLGSGAGFPGLILGLLRAAPVTLVESRRLRVDFLYRARALLGLEDNVEIFGGRAERMPPQPFAAISARAFAPLGQLFELGIRFAAPDTLWVLPKGRNAKSELEAARASWQGAFRLEPSVTDADAAIIVAERVRRRSKGSRAG